MADPIASSILLEMATVIENTTPPSWRVKPPFVRRRILAAQGGGLEQLPDPKDPIRTRKFDLLFESSTDDPSMASDESRWTFTGVILVRIYYPDMGAVKDDKEAFTAARMQVDDHMMLHKRLIQQQLVKAEVSGVSIQHNTQAVYLAGQTDWRVTARWEEII
jgi:hypothetical protein